MNFEMDAGVATITFNRPRQLNALDVETAEAFLAAARRIQSDPSVRVVVLKGAGRAFMAGGDIAYLHAAADKAAAARRLIAPMHEALSLLNRAPILTIAALKGPVAGAGLSLALFADFAVSASDAVLNMAYIKIAAPPDCGATWRLPRLVGLRRATEIMLLAEPIAAHDALQWGLVNRVVASDELERNVAELAAHLVAGSPHALRATKSLLEQVDNDSFDAQLDRELAAFVACAGTPEFDQALTSFFSKSA